MKPPLFKCPKHQAPRLDVWDRTHYLILSTAMVWFGLTGVSTGNSLENIELSPVVSEMLQDPVLTKTQRRSMVIFHGQWNELENPTTHELAQIAIQRYDLSHPALLDRSASAVTRARAALEGGNAQLAIDGLRNETSAQAAVIKAQALESIGMIRQAVATLTTWLAPVEFDTIAGAAEQTAAAQAIAMLARLEGRSGKQYTTAMALLGKVREETDPLYWPAHIAEAQLLIEKDNAPEAAITLIEALKLNPVCSWAWYLLGQIAAEGFDLDTARLCGSRLRQANPTHLLADMLETQILLIQKEPLAAQAVAEAALSRYPKHHQMRSFLAAAYAMRYQNQALQATLHQIDQQSPNHPLVYYTVGRYLSMARQYDAGQVMLQTAIDRNGNWPKPRIELGLLLMQKGDEAGALTALRHAVRLDPYNRRANNQLKLAEKLNDYQTIQTDHFVIRYQNGIDEVLARDMPHTLEQIYEHLTSVFDYRPPSPTIIEIMPDEKQFAVRITGMPDIWTFAACTGNVIALTPPRSGPDLGGTYDWARVIQHEFVHTITLNRTGFRIPHWFTEGCAVSQEPGDRPFDERLLLAQAHHNQELFDLDEINLAFVRPKKPQDRLLAYAQASWIVAYITDRYGFNTILQMLDFYRHGVSNTRAIRDATGRDPQNFMNDFLDWAAQQVHDWGLQAPDESIQNPTARTAARDTNRGFNHPPAKHPQHPKLLKAAAVEAIKHEPPEQARLAVLRYASACPVDPWPDRQLVKLALLVDRPHEAIGSLQQLDRQDSKTGQWAHQLAQIHRVRNRPDLAVNAIRRALHRQPYHPAYRELAATVALQAGDERLALHHLRAMATLEPNRAIHQLRLAALYTRMGQHAQARTAAQTAQKMNPSDTDSN